MIKVFSIFKTGFIICKRLFADVLFIIGKLLVAAGYFLMDKPNTAKQELGDIYSDSIRVHPKDIFR